MATLLVTGGAGFIGGTFVRRLLRTKAVDKVVNLDLLTYAGNLDSLSEINADPRHVFVQGNIQDKALIAELLQSYRPTAVVHFAAESHVDRSIGSPSDFIQTNVVGTFELLHQCLAYWRDLAGTSKDDFRFLHISTDEVYGSLGPTGKFLETTPYDPSSPYSASKAASDHLVRAYERTYGLPTMITNCSNNYGPYQFPEKLIPLMILNAMSGKPLPVYGDGANIRDWLFVEDHCRAIQAVLEGGRVGEVYNVGGNCERTNLEVVNKICAVVDDLCPALNGKSCNSLIKFVTDRPGHDRRYAIDCSKLTNELGWEPAVTFEEGLEQTVRWYLEHPEWVERVTSGKYRGERLGLLTKTGS